MASHVPERDSEKLSKLLDHWMLLGHEPHHKFCVYIRSSSEEKVVIVIMACNFKFGIKC